MAQRIFDVENKKDMADLWNIVPDDVNKIENVNLNCNCYIGNCIICTPLIKINWHDKTEITRPMPEATEADVGKFCYFWDGDDEDYSKQIGLLTTIKTDTNIFKFVLAESICFAHCRRLTKQEIKELC